ncbi:hypothetical protein LCGC14_2981230, partial [marine sediment metagenome]
DDVVEEKVDRKKAKKKLTPGQITELIVELENEVNKLPLALEKLPSDHPSRPDLLEKLNKTSLELESLISQKKINKKSKKKSKKKSNKKSTKKKEMKPKSKKNKTIEPIGEIRAEKTDRDAAIELDSRGKPLSEKPSEVIQHMIRDLSDPADLSFVDSEQALERKKKRNLTG